ncbi:hypothetical protein LZ198_27720 [Myxococcus sp. K15C18031901]|uniref:hypothetical protein n=1 Tax=Myxococcus dinghuensis TaxID=2906761 RepID=UPI0020A72E66|nr:hypothetical protein [Myxococcus dinghuensis]MCP3102670.1 hypothetical protein [Myxococcus dinghuensis]
MNIAEKSLYGVVGGSGALLLAFYVRALQGIERGLDDGNPISMLFIGGALGAVIPAFGLVWLLTRQQLSKHPLWLVVSPPLLFLLAVVAAPFMAAGPR